MSCRIYPRVSSNSSFMSANDICAMIDRRLRSPPPAPNFRTRRRTENNYAEVGQCPSEPAQRPKVRLPEGDLNEAALRQANCTDFSVCQDDCVGVGAEVRCRDDV